MNGSPSTAIAARALPHVSVWFRVGNDQDQLTSVAASPDALTRGITVAVCTYKRPAALTRFLDSLAAQARKADRLIIVDASPDDRTERAVRDHRIAIESSDLLYFRVTGQLQGLTRQRNFALRWVTTDLVAFFDDDVVLQPSCCLELERQHRQPGARVVGVGALIENQLEPPRLLWRLRARFRVVSSLRPGTYSRSGFSIPWSFLSPSLEGLVEGQWLPGGATMWRTALAREVGFNEAFSGYCCGEDLDFSLRMGAHGALAVTGRARVLHLHDASGRPDPFRLGYMSASNWYDIHRRCLQGRTKWDHAYFVYALVLDTLLQSLGLTKPREWTARWRLLHGRWRFLAELLLRGIRRKRTSQ